MKNNNLMRIKDLERLSGINRSTIHYYLQQGLLHQPIKTGKTMSYYNESHLKRLIGIRETKKEMRLPISFIKNQLDGEVKPSIPNNRFADKPDRLYLPSAKQKRKREIMDAAIRLFSKKGYHQTCVQDITNEIGISVGTFYIYFSNKRELFIEIVEDMVKTINKAISDKNTANMNFFEIALLRARILADNYYKYGKTFLQLEAETSSEDPSLASKIEEVYRALADPAIKEVRQAQKSGLIRNVDPELLVFAIMGICSIMAIRLRMDNKYTQEGMINSIFDLFMNGLSP